MLFSASPSQKSVSIYGNLINEYDKNYLIERENKSRFRSYITVQFGAYIW